MKVVGNLWFSRRCIGKRAYYVLLGCDMWSGSVRFQRLGRT